MVLARDAAPPTPPLEGNITPALQALEWSADFGQVTPEDQDEDDALLPPDALMPLSAQSPDVPPHQVFVALAGRVAQCALLAVKVSRSMQSTMHTG